MENIPKRIFLQIGDEAEFTADDFTHIGTKEKNLSKNASG
jgi:hypothetical protein